METEAVRATAEATPAVRRAAAPAAATDEGVRRGSIRVEDDTDVEAVTTTATGVRRRADGSTSTVRMTTETPKLSDAPVSREREVQTTATVRVQDAGQPVLVHVELSERAFHDRCSNRRSRTRSRTGETTAPPEAKLD